MINDLWYKNAVIYCLSVASFMDANGDGIGDFQGLMRRLDYLHGLGITAIWLMPFQPSPYRDDGYDVADYYGVGSRHGTLGDFVEFTHAARATRYSRDHGSRRQSYLRSTTLGFRRRAAIQIPNIAIGTSGPTRNRPMPTKEWCFREYRNRPGLTTRLRAPGIFTAFIISNLISIPRTGTSRRKS